jgi:hypothetical protein
LNRRPGWTLVMVATARDRRGLASEQLDEIHAVIPVHEVLTELARGFLLVRDSDPERAVRFAATFLRERDEPNAASAGRPSPPSTAGPALGRGGVAGVDRRELLLPGPRLGRP